MDVDKENEVKIKVKQGAHLLGKIYKDGVKCPGVTITGPSLTVESHSPVFRNGDGDYELFGNTAGKDGSDLKKFTFKINDTADLM